MIYHPDHMTVAVTHLEEAKAFFELLNFQQEHDVVIEKDPFCKLYEYSLT